MSTKKTYLGAFTILFSLSLFAQRGDELMVYAVKGKVTALYKKKETTVMIGKVLVPGAVIKTGKDASLTMLCNKGKPIQVAKQGSFPVSKWRDSCRVSHSSVTTNYFKYIWDELYSYSPENKAKRRRDDLAVSRGDPPPVPGGIKPVKFTKLVFSKGMDTLNYDGTDFPLSWTGTGYRGFYHFTLYDDLGQTVIFKDSLKTSFIPIGHFSHLLDTGKSYSWTVFATGVPISRKRVLNYVQAEETGKLTEFYLRPTAMPEDSATTSFRVAYMLEQRHFLAAAFQWYRKANEQNPEMILFRDKLIRFRNEYWLR